MKQIYVTLIALICLTFSFDAQAQCNYRLELTDNFGKDWDSGDNLMANTGVDVTIDGTTTTYLIVNPSPTPNTPVTENYVIPVNDMSTIDIDYRATDFPGDGQFKLFDSEDILVYESPIAQPSTMNIFVGTASCPTCPVVSNLVSTNITANEAEISWTNGGTETQWEVEYGISPYTPGNGGTIDPAPTNPFTIMGLSSVTTYDVYVRAVCVHGSDVSASVGPITFTTAESCPSPSNFAPISQSAFEIQFAWDANGNSSLNYEVNYGPAPFNQGDAGGTTEMYAFGSFAAIGNLMSDTEYSFYVRYDCGMGDFSLWAGPYTATTSISCPAISGLTAAATDSSLDISWTAGGTETEWEVDYALAGVITAPGTGQGVPAQGTTQTTTTLNLTSLPSATAYDVYVRAICDPATNDLSQWVNATFVTLPRAPNGVTCPNNDSAFAWDEGFDSTTTNWTGDTGATTGNWEFGATAGTGSTGTGPLSPEVGAGYVFFDTSGGVNGTSVVKSVVSPVIDLTNATDEAELSFFFHSFGGDLTLFDVSVGTSPTGPFTSVFSYQGPLQANQTDPFVLVGAAMPASVLGSPTVYIRLSATEEAGNEAGFVGDVAVDLMRIETCGEFCSNPDSLALSNITTTGVDISFNDTNGTPAGSYEYVIQAPGTGLPTVAGTPSATTSITDNSLTPATSYEVYVRTTCGGIAGNSEWIGPEVFSTNCVPFTAPYFTDFEADPLDGLFICDDNIVIGNGVGTAPWVRVDDLISVSGSNHIYMYSGSTGATAELYYILPEFSDLSSDKRVRFNVYDRDTGGLEVGTMTDPSDPTTFVSSTVFTDADMTDDTYEEKTAYFPNLTTTGGFIAFKFNPLGTFDAIYLDDINYELSPDCPEPTNIVLSNETTSTIDVAWVDNSVGNATLGFEVLVQPSGTAAPDATVSGQSVTSSPVTINMLNPSSTFDVYVRANCDTDGFSEWSNSATASTLCADLIAPFTETFSVLNTTPNCWSQSATSGGPWVFNNNTTFNTVQCATRATDHTGNSGTFAWIDFSIPDTGVILETPQIDVSALTVPFLEFYQWMCTTGYSPGNQLIVEANDGTGTYTQVALIDTGDAAWTKYGFSLAPFVYNTNFVQLRFRGEQSTDANRFYGDLAIDDVSVFEAPTCLAPDNLDVANITATSADFSWNDPNPTLAPDYTIEYAITGTITTPGTGQGTEVLNVVNNPYSATMLSPNTSYEFYVSSNCGGANGSSRYTGPFAFVTNCAALTAPYFTSFESDPLDGLGNCDSNIVVGSGTGTAPWVRVDDLIANSGSQHMYMYSGSSTAANSQLFYILPEFSDLDATKRVRFFAYDRDLGGLEVGTMTDPTDFNTFTVARTFTNADLPDDVYQEQTVDFTSLTTTGGWVAFKFIPAGTFDAVYLDDINYEVIPSCPQPSAVTTANPTANSIELSWTVGGAETEWIVEYGTPGFTPGGVGSLGTRTGVMSNTNYLLDMLTANTEYEIRIFAVCAPNDISPSTNPITIRTFPGGPQGVTCPNNDNAFVWEESFDNNNAGWTGDIGTGITGGAWNFGFSGPTGSLDTGPSGAQEGTGYVYFETSGTFNGPNAIVSPPIDLTNATDEAELSFFYHSYGGDPTLLEVEVGTSPTGPFTQIFTYTGQIQTSSADPFALVGGMMPATVLGNSTVYIRINASDPVAGFVGDIGIDLMRIESCGAFCSNPDNLTVSNITPTSVDISFNDTNGMAAGAYEYVIQAPGTGVPTASGIASATTTITDGSLTAATPYEVYVRTICGGMSGNSDWVGPVTFDSACVAFTAPYFTDFETDPLDGLFICDNNILDNLIGTGTIPWVRVDDLIANSGSKHLYMYSGSDATAGIYYVMPEFSDLDANKRVRFFAYDRDLGGLEVGTMSDPNDASTFIVAQTFTNADLPDDQYAEQTVNFTSLTTTGGHVAFRYVQPATFDAIYLDDINYEVIPSCPNPTGLTVNSIGDDNLDLSWNAGNTETEWIVEYATPDFASGTPIQVTGVTSNTNYILNGLVPNTPYQVRVFAVCNPMDISPAANPVRVRTFPIGPLGVSCTTGAPGYIFEDNFDANNGWTGDIGATTGNWEFIGNAGTGSTGTGPLGPEEGTGYAFFDTSGGVNGTAVVRSMVSPAIDLTTGANDELELSFFFHSFGGDQTTFEVGYGTSATGPFTNIFTFVGPLQAAQGDQFAPVGAMLPSSLIGQTIYIQLTATEEAGNEAGFIGDVAIDLMRIQTCGTFCIDPTGVAVSNVTGTTAQVSWTENGTATAWEVAVVPDGNGTPTSNGTATTNNPYTATGLSPQTSYEVYVRSDCGGGFFSDWTIVETFTTGCPIFTAPYGSATGAPGNDFSSFPGACWTEGDNTDIATGPNGLDGDWESLDFANDSANAFGKAAGVNIADNFGEGAWLVSPEIDLGPNPATMLTARFDVALTAFFSTAPANFGSDDQVQFLITTDSGATWTIIETFEASDNISATGQLETFALGAYSGVVSFAFRSTNGTVADGNDVNFFVDNFTIDGTVGVNDNELFEFSFYPNPTDNVVNFDGQQVMETITVRNLLGQQLFVSKPNATSSSIDFTTFPSGMYLVEVTSGEQSRVVKVMRN